MIYVAIAIMAFLVITIFWTIIVYLSDPKTIWQAIVEASGLAICIVVVLVFIACLTVDWAEMTNYTVYPVK